MLDAADIISTTGSKLRSFQLGAVKKFLPQTSVILGHDMGLGKTVTAIALDRVRRSAAPWERGVGMKTLVLCPMSVISNWEDHFAEWYPGLSVCIIDRKNRDVFEKAVAKGAYDVYICHWDVVRLMPELAKHTWFHIIADEAHRIGNYQAQVTVKVKRIKHKFLTECTGTPCTSKPQQFWSLLNWVRPYRFTSYHRFFNHHVVFVQHNAGDDCPAMIKRVRCGKFHKNMFRVIIGIAHEKELQDEIAPFYERVLKEEVLDDLPDKDYTTIKVDLDPKQRRAYEDMRVEMLAWVGAHEDEPLAASQAVVKLVRLQQLACAYARTAIEQKRQRHKHRSEVQAAVIENPSTACPPNCDKIWDLVEVKKVYLQEPSSKLDAVMEILNDNPDQQFVIFSQSKQVIRLLETRLFRADIPHGILTGDTEQNARGDLIRAFQRGNLRVFAGTIAAGGEGITLTAASTCIFLDRSWSPAKNKQAEDRLHRIGQKNAVQIIDVVARHTVDMGRLQRLETSWQFIKTLLGDRDAKTKPEGSYI